MDTFGVFGIFGFIAFVMMAAYSGLPTKVKKLERQLKLLQRTSKGGGNKMSKMIEELIGKKCKITIGEDFSIVNECRILAVDDDWLKYQRADKKGIKTQLIHLDAVTKIELIEAGEAATPEI